MAPPVSCATMSRLSGCGELGQVVARKTGTPSGMTRGSTAMERSAVSGTPREPIGPVRLNPIPNGPLMVEGRVEFRAAAGVAFVTEERTWLCHCGQSANKPFCDRTHKKVGFAA